MRFFYKNWFFHNVIAHPLMYLAAFYDVELSKNIHDSTLPNGSFDGGKFPITMGVLLAYGIFNFTVDLYRLLLMTLGFS